VFDWLKYILGGASEKSKRSSLYRQWVEKGRLPSEAVPEEDSKPLTVGVLGKREVRIKELESVVEVEEAKNRELEERLEFKRREDEVLDRVRGARAREKKLWELLGEYGTKRSGLLKWVLIGGGLLLLILLMFTC